MDFNGNKSIGGLKDEITQENPNKLKCDIDELRLELAKRKGAWLPYASDATGC